MKKQKLPADPYSESALKWCVKNWDDVLYLGRSPSSPEIYLYSLEHKRIVAHINLREIIRRRAPLTGIKKQMAGIVRGKRAKKKVLK